MWSRRYAVGTSAQPKPLEAVYQDEFYRVFNSLLSSGSGISSEWSRGSSGRIDFRIVGPKWGIELVRDGNRLTEHCQRFLPGGAYFQWIQDGFLSDSIILDCGHQHPKPCSKIAPISLFLSAC